MFLIEIFKVIVLGIVEGVTEFLPVSSTGHLILVEHLLNLNSANQETFAIAIQLGAILAVLVLYRKYFINIFLKTKWFSKEMNKILIAIMPAVFMGFLLHSFIKEYLFSPFTVAIGLIFGSFVMIVGDRISKIKKQQLEKIEDINYKKAFFIGCFQCLALWPGVSRSGATITGGLCTGLSYNTSAEFSFIVAVPIMFLATGFDLYKSANTLTSTDLFYILIGFIISFLVAIFSIVIFLKILNKLKLLPFAIYRIFLAIVVLFLL